MYYFCYVYRDNVSKFIEKAIILETVILVVGHLDGRTLSFWACTRIGPTCNRHASLLPHLCETATVTSTLCAVTVFTAPSTPPPPVTASTHVRVGQRHRSSFKLPAPAPTRPLRHRRCRALPHPPKRPTAAFSSVHPTPPHSLLRRAVRLIHWTCRSFSTKVVSFMPPTSSKPVNSTHRRDKPPFPSSKKMLS
jgi:hypothetical protein